MTVAQQIAYIALAFLVLVLGFLQMKMARIIRSLRNDTGRNHVEIRMLFENYWEQQRLNAWTTERLAAAEEQQKTHTEFLDWMLQEVAYRPGHEPAPKETVDTLLVSYRKAKAKAASRPLSSQERRRAMAHFRTAPFPDVATPGVAKPGAEPSPKGVRVSAGAGRKRSVGVGGAKRGVPEVKGQTAMFDGTVPHVGDPENLFGPWPGDPLAPKPKARKV